MPGRKSAREAVARDPPSAGSSSIPIAHGSPYLQPLFAGWQPGEIRSRMFRHTYCAARLQTLDQGAPVSLFTAAKELGHGGEAMVRRVYGHLGQVRHRAEEVEYRIEAFGDKLKGRLAALRGAV